MSGGGVDDRTTWKERKRSVGPSPTAEDLYGELSFTAKLVRVDADNKYAWSHRQWALEALGKGYTDELGFCNEILASKRNIHNRLVWDQRFFAVKKCLEQGLMIIRSCEVSFATDHISWYPENENPWRYLRLLCKGEMEALAVSQRLHWALRNVFVDARDSIHAVTADKNLHNKDEGHHVLLFHSVNKRGCLFALDLVSDLLSHGYRPHKEVVDAIEDLFKEFEGPGLAKRVDSVLQKHRMEVMELSADLTRMMVINRPGGMNTSCGYTPLSDHLNNPTNSNFIWSKEDNRWVTAEDTPKLVFPSQQCGVGTPKRRPRPGKYSQLCGVAGFSPIPVYFFPEDPCFIEYVKEGSAFGGDPIRIQDTVQDTVQFTDNRGDFPPEYNGEYKNLPESLRKCCWEIINSPEVDFDLFSNELVFCQGHDNPAAWQVRRLVIHARKLDLQKEVENLELLSERSSDNYLYWHQRRWVSEKIGKTAVEKELEFTNNILSKDANNYHAWSHRQWVFEVLGGVGWEEVELEYCNKFLEKDSSNCFAWNQRYFVGRRETTMLPEEVGYAMKAIKAEPENEMPWTYLQSLMIFEKDKQEEWLRFNCLKYTCEPLLIKLAKVGERDAIKKKRVVNALKMLLFVLLHNFPGFVNSDTDLFCFFLNWPLISQTLKSIDVTWI